MKTIPTLLSTLILGAALALTACGKDKKPATTTPDPAAQTAPAADPAQSPAEDQKADDKPMTNDKPATGGW